MIMKKAVKLITATYRLQFTFGNIVSIIASIHKNYKISQ